MNLHVFGATEKGELWHTIGKFQISGSTGFQWEPWGDVDRHGGAGHPGTGNVLESACAADVKGNLHVLVVTDDDGGQLWHTIRATPDAPPPLGGTWQPFGDVDQAAGLADVGASEKIVAVTAATTEMKLHVLATTKTAKLVHAIWIPATKGPTIWKKGPGGDPAKWEQKFKVVSVPANPHPEAGRPGQFKTIESTFSK